VYSVLVADDDSPIRRMLVRTLEAEGYEVVAAAGGGEALAAVEGAAPDLLVLDVAMPGVDGLAVCRRLRARGLALPILLLTARDAVQDRVAGLDAGADDYLVKPFATEELLARARALLRRGREPVEQLGFDDVVLDVQTRQARRARKVIPLSGRETELLELLLRNPRQVITREQALDRIWGSPSAASSNVVDQYVASLRRKLGEPPLIHAVRGVGFASTGDRPFAHDSSDPRGVRFDARCAGRRRLRRRCPRGASLTSLARSFTAHACGRSGAAECERAFAAHDSRVA
jgi:two-component system response regulator MprA